MTTSVDAQGTAAPAAAPDVAPTAVAAATATPATRTVRSIGAVAVRAAGNAGWMLVGAAVSVALWQLAAAQSDGVPTPVEGAQTFIDLVSDPLYDRGPNDKGIAVQLFTSLQRVFAGFVMAALVGIPAGLLIGASRRAWLAFNPIVQLLRPVSPLAWFPIWLVVLTDAAQASVFVIFITALWPTLVNTAAGAAHIPHDQRSVARVFRFGRIAYVRHVLLPNALPSIITGLRLSMGIAWMVIVAVEMLSGNSGIGFFVWDSYNAGKLSAVVAAIVLIGLIGFVLDTLLMRLSRRVAIEEVRA